MSYIVRQGTLNDKPVLGVSINYRVAAFGFLDSVEVMVRFSPDHQVYESQLTWHL